MPEHTPKVPQGFFDKFFALNPVPAGYMNVKQIAKSYGITEAAARAKFHRLVNEGQVDRIYVRESVGARSQEVAYYGPPVRNEPGH